ncbi:MAG: M16 family metallopeptidase [Bacteroidia bacterium]
MITIDRSITPGFHTIEKLSFPEYQKIEIKKQLFLYALKAGTQAVIRLDFVFEAGLINQLISAQATFTASMLSEGTKQKTALELAEALDYYGSYFQTRANADDAIATLYCLEKHLTNCLPLFLEALGESAFPEKELDIQKKNGLSKLLVNEKKNSYLCKKNYYKNMYGSNHPYASFNSKENIQSIQKEIIQSFYQSNYIKGLKYAMLSGNFSEGSTKLICDTIQSSDFEYNVISTPSNKIETSIGNHFIEKSDSVQSALRIGRISIGRNHEDFRKLQFLNLIFGGYFGSRLMKNIREDKGLTYGIYSVLESNKLGSSWYIDTDINTKNRDLGIVEIYKEIKKIQTEPIPNNELETARNYYLGSFLKSLDGPFSLADRLKIMIDNNLPNSYYPEFVGILNSSTSDELQQLANKYFSIENIVEVVVGKK